MTEIQVIEEWEKAKGINSETLQVLLLLAFIPICFFSITFERAIAIRIVIGMAAFALISLIGFAFYSAIKKQDVLDWKRNIAHPYVNSLAIEKRELVRLAIDMSEMNDYCESNLYTRRPRFRQRKVEATFVDGGLLTLRGWYEVSIDLNAGEKPYISYQRVSRWLGAELDKGCYNPRIHLPKDYNFHYQ